MLYGYMGPYTLNAYDTPIVLLWYPYRSPLKRALNPQHETLNPVKERNLGAWTLRIP